MSKLIHRSSQLSLDSTNLAQCSVGSANSRLFLSPTSFVILNSLGSPFAKYSHFVPLSRNSSTAVRRSPFSCVLKRRLLEQLLACYQEIIASPSRGEVPEGEKGRNIYFVSKLIHRRSAVPLLLRPQEKAFGTAVKLLYTPTKWYTQTLYTKERGYSVKNNLQRTPRAKSFMFHD